MKWMSGIVIILICLTQSARVYAGGGKAKAHVERERSWGEISLMGSYSKTDYGNHTYSTTRHYTGTIGINLTSVTEIEASYAYTDSFFNQDPIQTSAVNEQSLGLSLVQGLFPPIFVQPYVKAGAAQYNRKQSGTTSGIPTAPVSTKSPSGILGAGIKIFLLQSFSLKIEGVSYLPNFNISGAKNNFSIQGGISWNF